MFAFFETTAEMRMKLTLDFVVIIVCVWFILCSPHQPLNIERHICLEFYPYFIVWAMHLANKLLWIDWFWLPESHKVKCKTDLWHKRYPVLPLTCIENHQLTVTEKRNAKLASGIWIKLNEWKCHWMVIRETITKKQVELAFCTMCVISRKLKQRLIIPFRSEIILVKSKEKRWLSNEHYSAGPAFITRSMLCLLVSSACTHTQKTASCKH